MDTPKYELNALNKFKCLASDCPDDCCSYGAWNISVDEATIEKWKNIGDDAVRERVLGAVSEHKSENGNLNLVASKGMVCSLLEPDGMCFVHDKIGADHLGDTCRLYPRYSECFTNYSLNSAVMSCPEITRLLLDEPKVTDVFNLSGGFDDKEDPSQSINTFVTGIINKNNYSIAAKIITISRLLVNISYLSEREELTLAGFNGLCRKLNKPLKNAEQDVKSKRLKIEADVAGLFWYIVYQIVTSGDSSPLDKRIQSHTIANILNNKSYTEESCAELYKEIVRMRKSSEPEMKRIMSGVGERFLSVKFKSIGFPLAPPNDNFIAAFLFGVFPYCFINLCLWIIFDVEKKLSKDDIVNVIYKTERLVQHSDRIYNSIVKHKMLLHIDDFEACFSDLL